METLLNLLPADLAGTPVGWLTIVLAIGLYFALEKAPWLKALEGYQKTLVVVLVACAGAFVAWLAGVPVTELNEVVTALTSTTFIHAILNVPKDRRASLDENPKP